MFVDKVVLELRAGKGGNGVIAWRREKYLPKGGPFGGDGGEGGSLILVADPQIPSLEAYRNSRILKAEDGKQGASNQQKGRNGTNLILKVPVGTLVKDSENQEILFDFTEPLQEWKICKGGKGGRGNASFKSPTNRAPAICTSGKMGEQHKIELELKLIADIGLVGFPNAGKSSFFTATSKVRAKIAAYPFTTLRPSLGFIFGKSGCRFLLADIPGIIEGASLDRGLGFEFLRHIERTHLLLYILDASGIDGRDPKQDFITLQEELKAYDPLLLKKPFAVALNKIDAEEALENIQVFKSFYPFDPATLFEISAKTGEGIPSLIQYLISDLEARKCG